MDCISIQQPWAYAILHLGKRTENRSWACPPNKMHKRIGLHAGLTIDRRGGESLWSMVAPDLRANIPGYEEMTRGAILGCFTIIGCDRDCRTPFDVPDLWHWRLADVLLFNEVVPFKGRLGFFPVPDELLPEVR